MQDQFFASFPFKNFIQQGLSEIKFKTLTLCQKKVIPLLLKNKNVICQAETGSGKTHAFLLPILNQINLKQQQIQSLIFCPTQELATQIKQNLQIFQKYEPRLKVALFMGSHSIKTQYEKYKNNLPHIVVGTPQRIKSLYFDFNLPFTFAKQIIIDEIDMIFDFNFIADIKVLFEKMSSKTKVSVFSAFISKTILKFIQNNFPCFEKVILNHKGQLLARAIEHILIPIRFQKRIKILSDLVAIINPYLCLIFANNKNEIATIYKTLKKNKVSVTVLYKGLTNRERKQTIKKIKNLYYNFVVCSDVMARGIDIVGISHIISYRFPLDLKYYLHRAGRTGRNQNSGTSFIIYDHDDIANIQKLKEQGCNFQVWQLKNQQLLPVVKNQKPRLAIKAKPVFNYQINKALDQFPQNRIKPGYRVKRKNRIKRIKQKQKKQTNQTN